jgi:methionyl-tRNA formyltransferase
MRAVFLGTPAIAVPALSALAERAEVVGVVCQPDRPAGRGLRMHSCAVKEFALAHELDLYQPARVRSGELRDWLELRRPEFALVMAYGRILPRDVLAAPRLGCLNLHASLLPKYRGAAPIQWALIRGEATTGISLMQMDEGLDTGPVFAERPLPIAEDETAGSLERKLAALAADVVRGDLESALDGRLLPKPQDERLATHAPPLTAEHAPLDFSSSAIALERWVRALSPEPGAKTWARGKLLKIHRASVAPSRGLSQGEVAVEKPDRIWVGTGDGTLRILEAQLEGKKTLSARELVNGRCLQDGWHLPSRNVQS